MGTVIYRNNDNTVMTEVIQFPLYDTEIFQKFIASGDYVPTEYSQIEIPEGLISEAKQKKVIIVDGKITFGNDRNPVDLIPVTPSEADVLTDYIVDVDYRVTKIELGL